MFKIQNDLSKDILTLNVKGIIIIDRKGLKLCKIGCVLNCSNLKELLNKCWYIKYLPNLILILALCNGDDTCCTSSNQCDIGEGDCDKDLDCIGNLFCGKDNCVGDTFEEDDDCCTDSSQLKNQISEY